MEFRRIYEYALQREREGQSFFQTNAERMSHAAATEIFHRLAEEEHKHILFIESLLSTLNDERKLDTSAASDLTEGRFFLQRAKSEMLDQTVMESMAPDLPILRMAYLIERDFSEFYEMAASRTEGDAKQALSMLAEWERGHEQLFKELHDQIFEEYAKMPWGG
jgi:rubrerythrin